MPLFIILDVNVHLDVYKIAYLWLPITDRMKLGNVGAKYD